jgi:hypothetical protein
MNHLESAFHPQLSALLDWIIAQLEQHPSAWEEHILRSLKVALEREGTDHAT